jgi:hypothetical protein
LLTITLIIFMLDVHANIIGSQTRLCGQAGNDGQERQSDETHVHGQGSTGLNKPGLHMTASPVPERHAKSVNDRRPKSCFKLKRSDGPHIHIDKAKE